MDSSRGKDMKTRSATIFFMLIAVTALFFGCAQTPPETTPAQAETPSQTPKSEEKVDCPVGAFIRTQQGEFKITGIEKQTVAGKSMDMCCMEFSSGAVREKFCHDMVSAELGMWGYRNAVYWITDKETGKFYKAAEGYEKDGKYCLQNYDLSGNTMEKICMYKQGTQTCMVLYDENGQVQMEACQ